VRDRDWGSEYDIPRWVLFDDGNKLLLSVALSQHWLGGLWIPLNGCIYRPWMVHAYILSSSWGNQPCWEGVVWEGWWQVTLWHIDDVLMGDMLMSGALTSDTLTGDALMPQHIDKWSMDKWSVDAHQEVCFGTFLISAYGPFISSYSSDKML
jgi:hypothetical protein